MDVIETIDKYNLMKSRANNLSICLKANVDTCRTYKFECKDCPAHTSGECIYEQTVKRIVKLLYP